MECIWVGRYYLWWPSLCILSFCSCSASLDVKFILLFIFNLMHSYSIVVSYSLSLSIFRHLYLGCFWTHFIWLHNNRQTIHPIRIFQWNKRKPLYKSDVLFSTLFSVTQLNKHDDLYHFLLFSSHFDVLQNVSLCHNWCTCL